jgi:membrane-associated phospholipid phosphatase
MLRFITDFADQAVVLPVALAVAISWVVAGWRRAALAWSAAVFCVLAVTAFGKMATAACGPFDLLPGLRSPSGHTASAAVVYGGLVALLLPVAWERSETWRVTTAAALAGLAAVLFGGTRLLLHVHTRTDVLAGAVVGMAGALLLARLAGPRPAAVRLAVPVGVALVTILLFHGGHLHAEERLHDLSFVVWPLTLCLPR